MQYHNVRLSNKDIQFLMQLLRRVIDGTQSGDEANNRSVVLRGRLTGHMEREIRAPDRSANAEQRDSIASMVHECMADTGCDYATATARCNVD